jgi:WD40 repeat protein
MLAACGGTMLQVWDVDNWKVLDQLGLSLGPCTYLVFSTDGEILATGHKGVVGLWSADNLTNLGTLYRDDGHCGITWSMAFQPNGKLLAQACDHVLCWDVRSKEMVVDLGPGRAVAFTPESGYVVVGTYDEGIRVAPVGRWSESQAVTTGPVVALAFSPDGTRLASGGEDVDLWQIYGGNRLLRVQSLSGGAYGVAFSIDGSLLATAGSDKMIRLWIVSSGGLVNTLSGHSEAIWNIAFSPDGALLASASPDGTVKVWYVRQ